MAEEKVTLINKLVKASSAADGIDNRGIISFMYPGFVKREEIFYDQDKDVLFFGKSKQGLRQELEQGTRNFIAVVSTGLYDIDFTNRETIVKVLYSKWDKTPTEETLKLLYDMTDHDFWDFFKKFWILGSSKTEKENMSMMPLFKNLGKQRYDILKFYFELREVYSDSHIFSSLLGFLEKSLDPSQYDHMKGGYPKALQDCHAIFGNSIRPLVQQAYFMKSSTPGEKEYRTMWMLYRMGKGNFI